MGSVRRRFAVYQQAADDLRDAIGRGVYLPGSVLPGERILAGRLGVGRDCVRQALAVLACEGLVVRDAGVATTVAPEPVYSAVSLPVGASVTARMPSPDERLRLGIEPRVGVPVLVVRVAGNPHVLYPADRFELATGSACPA
jgi:DNA-binding FadR family transcriptional regulator